MVAAFPDDYPFWVPDCAEFFGGIESLLWLARYEGWEGTGKTEAVITDAFVNSCNLRSISYNSPLEVVVGISAAGIVASGAVAVVADRLLGVWDRFNESRRLHAGTSAYLAAARAVEETFKPPEVPIQANAESVEHFGPAGRLLAQLDSLEITEQ